MEDDAIRKLIPIELKNFDGAIKQSKDDEIQAQSSKVGNTPPGRVSASLAIILFAFVAAVAALNIMKLVTGGVSVSMLPIEVVWYLAIAVSLFFLRKGARLGSLIAGNLLGYAEMVPLSKHS